MTFAATTDENPRKRPSSSDEQEQQPVTKKQAFGGDDTVAFSQRFVKGKNTTAKKDPNVIPDLILVLVWIMKLSRLFCGIFKLQNLSEIEDKKKTNNAYRFARWLNRLKGGMNEEETELIETLAEKIPTEKLQKFKNGSVFCNDDENKQILDTKPELFAEDYDFGKSKLTKTSCVSTLLAIFTKHGTTIYTLFHALTNNDDDDDEFIDLIFRKLYSVVTAFKFVTELGNLACICISCKTRVVDVFCDSCKYMSVCSVCYNNPKTNNVKCGVCKTKMDNVVYGYNTETPINPGDESTSALYSSSVRTIPQIQASTRKFSSKHKTSGLIGKTCDLNLPKEDRTKAFVSFVTSVENALMKLLGAVETFLNQGDSKGIRLCDSCRNTVATKRLRYRPTTNPNEETVIAICDGCFETKTDDTSTDDSTFIRFSTDSLYRGANMNLTAATLQLDLSSVPLDSRHRGYLKKDNKRGNVDALCSKYKINAQSKSQEDSVLTLKTVLKQIFSWGADEHHTMKTYFDHINEKMALCWPINDNNHFIQVDENDEAKEVENHELFFSKSIITLLQPQSHEKRQEQPHPYIKQILQILKVKTDNNNEKITGLKAVLEESEVCICNESVILIGKLFRKLGSSELLSELDDDCQIVGFYNKEFYPHPKNMKKGKKPQRKSKKEEKEEEEEEEEKEEKKEEVKDRAAKRLYSSDDDDDDDDDRPPPTPGAIPDSEREDDSAARYLEENST